MGEEFDWPDYVDEMIAAREGSDTADYGEGWAGYGEGWLAWRQGSTQYVVVRSDDGLIAKAIKIQPESTVHDMMASARWVATLSPTEKDRALAAIEALEAVDA